MSKDKGTFLIPAPGDEQMIIAQLRVQAMNNPVKPNKAWIRFPGTVTSGATTRTGYRVYHADLEAGFVRITEEWGGKETARKTIQLDVN